MKKRRYLYDYLYGSKKKGDSVKVTYSSDEMIGLASKWTNDFINSAPKLVAASYDKDEIYMFCCWILLDYGKNYRYIDENSNLDKFFETIYQAVRNTGMYNQTDMEQFSFRVRQYYNEINGMLNCDYPRTKMFFPKTLFARFIQIDFDHYNHPLFGIDNNLIRFSEHLGRFWNKVNNELISKYPQKH